MVRKILLLHSAIGQSLPMALWDNNTKDVFHYVTKPETRVDGPWTHMDTPGPVLFDDVTRPCRDITLKPFQQSLVDMVKVYSKRQVDVIYDRNGNIGKSVISNYLYIPWCSMLTMF